MTHHDWIASDNPAAMLAWLTSDAPRKPSDRKFRLFAVAMWRRIPDVLEKYNAVTLTDVAERMADQPMNREEIKAALRDAGDDHELSREVEGQGLPYSCYVIQASKHLISSLVSGPRSQVEKRAQADLLRAIIGDPFRPVTLDPHCRTPDVLAIAARIYDTRDWDVMPMLADAMETAGCEDARVLEWLRGPACEYCNGEGMLCGVYSAKLYTTVPLSHAKGWRSNTWPCPRCSGTGRIKPVRCRGDWAVDLVLGRK